MAWNEANIAVLRELYEKGIPTRRIAAELGMTKNMIVGKAGRLGLEHPNSTSPIEMYRPPYREIETPDFRHCQYPIGDVGQPGFRFCGDIAKARSSYCEVHHEKCHRAEQEREEYEKRRIKAGSKRVRVWVPADKVEELRTLAESLQRGAVHASKNPFRRLF